MQILGFGGEQLAAVPQIFQALSFDGAPALPPVPAFGVANSTLVPVAAPSSNAPLSLTLQAEPAVSAIQLIRNPPLPGVGKAPVQGSPPNSTAFVGAALPNLIEVQGSVPAAGAPSQPKAPQAAVSFTVTAPAAGQTQVTQTGSQSSPQPPQAAAPPYTLANSSASDAVKPAATAQSSAQPPPATAPSTAATAATAVPPAANPSLVQQLASTVQSLLIGKVYAQPVFSFLA